MNDSRSFQPNTLPTRLLRSALFLAVALSALSGCHKTARTPVDSNSTAPTPAPIPPVPTASLAAEPLAIDLGQSVVLNWRTTDATNVTIDGIGSVSGRLDQLPHHCQGHWWNHRSQHSRYRPSARRAHRSSRRHGNLRD